MKRHVKHTTRQNGQQEEQSQTAHTRQSEAREFTSPEELLREDIKQVVVPPAVEKRLSESIRALPKPQRPWWKRLLR